MRLLVPGRSHESLAFADGDMMLVSRGYHAVAASPGCEWRMQNDPDHEWLVEAGGH